MVKYILKDKVTGKYLGKINKKWIEVTQQEQAYEFTSMLAATNSMNHSIPKSINTKNYIAVTGADNPKPTQRAGYKSNIKAKSEALKGMQDSFYSAITYIDQSYLEEDSLTDSLSKIDQKISDIEHYIEFNNLSASMGYKAYKLLQQCRIERRDIKNKLSIIATMKSKNITSQGLCEILNAIKELDEKTYQPKQIESLFAGG